MRAVTIIAVILSITLIAAKTGYCTGRYVEKSPGWREGIIQEGDVFEYWCELPNKVGSEQTITLKLLYPNAEVITNLFFPREMYKQQVVVFP